MPDVLKKLDMLKKLNWPLFALAFLLVFNAYSRRGFFHVEVQNGKLSGSTIDILQNSAPTMIVALGMTLVIATGGVDLSVGALIAVAGSVVVVLLKGGTPLPLAILAAVVVCLVAGVWNGLLVAYVKVQPIVATLILMVAGRGIAQLLTDGQIVSVSNNAAFSAIDDGALLRIPLPIWIAAATFAILAALTRLTAWGLFIEAVGGNEKALTRLTAWGLFIEAVGGNEKACRYAGLSVNPIRLTVYTVSGLCAAVAGLIVASDIKAADASNAGSYMELDAILAVVIGGTALIGGRFLLCGSILGAVIIQTLTTTILMTNIPPEYNLIVKGGVVLLVCLLQSPSFRSRLLRLKGGR
ncbi:MAG: ABC transporter permease [Planctomycetes bacterium]|nr:ABC transporter permease [Planctomycetota bacterium]